MTMTQLARLSLWHDLHRTRRPLEGRVWDLLRTAWLAGTVGMPVAMLLDHPTGLVGAAVLFCCPTVYLALRASLHRRCWLRCDWLRA